MVPDTIFFMVNSSSLNAADDLSILVQIFIAQGVGYCKLWKFVGKMNKSRLKRIFFLPSPFLSKNKRYQLSPEKENQLLTEKGNLVTILTYMYDQHKRRRRRIMYVQQIYFISSFPVSEAVYVHKENVSIQSVHHIFTDCENLKLSLDLHHITLSCPIMSGRRILRAITMQFSTFTQTYCV